MSEYLPKACLVCERFLCKMVAREMEEVVICWHNCPEVRCITQSRFMLSLTSCATLGLRYSWRNRTTLRFTNGDSFPTSARYTRSICSEYRSSVMVYRVGRDSQCITCQHDSHVQNMILLRDGLDARHRVLFSPLVCTDEGTMWCQKRSEKQAGTRCCLLASDSVWSTHLLKSNVFPMRCK